MIDRRLLLALPGLLLAGPALALPAPGRIVFDALRKGRRIGSHIVTFEKLGDAFTARADVKLALAVGPVTVFSYEHHQVERWKAGQFVSIDTRTVQNGKKLNVSAKRTARGVEIVSSKLGTKLAPADALPLSHWNLASQRPPLFNPQDGKLLALKAARRPDVFAGVKTTRLSLSGEIQIDDWYDATGNWLGLDAKAEDGSIVQYRRA